MEFVYATRTIACSLHLPCRFVYACVFVYMCVLVDVCVWACVSVSPRVFVWCVRVCLCLFACACGCARPWRVLASTSAFRSVLRACTRVLLLPGRVFVQPSGVIYLGLECPAPWTLRRPQLQRLFASVFGGRAAPLLPPPPPPRLLWARQGVPGDPSGMRLILAPLGGHSLAFQGRGLAIMAGALSAVCARVPCFCPRSERHGTLAWHCSPHCGHLPTRVRIVIGFIKTYCTAVSGFMGSGCFDSTFNSLFDGDVCVFAGARALSKGQLYLFISVVSCAF